MFTTIYYTLRTLCNCSYTTGGLVSWGNLSCTAGGKRCYITAPEEDWKAEMLCYAKTTDSYLNNYSYSITLC